MNQKFPSRRFEVIRGTISELQVGQSEEDFVFNNTDKTLGGVAAAGLAAGGLAGAATGALLNTSDTEDTVSVFVCKVGAVIVSGSFGTVSFVDGDTVEVAGELQGNLMKAVAVTRPSDRTIWMHPHCGRGVKAYWRFVWRGTAWASMVPATVFVGALIYLQTDNGMGAPAWFWPVNWLGLVFMIATISIFVATRFTTFAHLSTAIFEALSFDSPDEVDLPKRQKELLKEIINDVRWIYHPMRGGCTGIECLDHRSQLNI